MKGLRTEKAQSQLDLNRRSNQSQKRRLDERNAPLQAPLQQDKRVRLDRVPDEVLPFAVYIEKFDQASSHRIKISSREWDDMMFGIINAFFLEQEKDKLKDACEKRLYNGEFVIYYTGNAFAQNWVIGIVNERLKLPGIKARGPRVETRPNFHVEFPAILDKLQPEICDPEGNLLARGN